MVQSARSRRLLVATAVFAMLLVSACSSKDKSTSPPTGGGALELNSPDLGHGAVYQHTFMNAGTFNYHCRFHGSMTATVVVLAGGAASASIGITDNAFGTLSVTVVP